LNLDSESRSSPACAILSRRRKHLAQLIQQTFVLPACNTCLQMRVRLRRQDRETHLTFAGLAARCSDCDSCVLSTPPVARRGNSKADFRRFQNSDHVKQEECSPQQPSFNLARSFLLLFLFSKGTQLQRKGCMIKIKEYMHYLEKCYKNVQKAHRRRLSKSALYSNLTGNKNQGGNQKEKEKSILETKSMREVI
jgi:hypothetical protein